MLQRTYLQPNCDWSLNGLENIFHFALEQKSKCLIQACIFIVEREFAGISSFSHRTQVKFLLESIRHIIGDNCQEEFIHIMQYLKLLHSLCSDVGCEEEYVNSILRIKQSFILFTLLDNESAANVCRVMNDFFPKHDPLESFNIMKRSLKKRFLALIKRQIYGFRKLVTKLLTDMEFRSYYFYDEWMEEFGSSFHKDMILDIDKYLRKIESCLLVGRKTNEIYQSWLGAKQISNPAVLYLLKIFLDHTVENGTKVEEMQFLKLLKWMFPSLDLDILTMPRTSSLEIPEVFTDLKSMKLCSRAGWTMTEKKPWDYEDFTTCIYERLNQNILDEQVEHEIGDKINEKHLSQGGPNQQRIPFAVLNENTAHLRVKTKKNMKRKRNDAENLENEISKRPRTEISTTKAVFRKSPVVDLCKKNIFMKPEFFYKYGKKEDSTIRISIDSPQCKRLLESGSKFFSSLCQEKRMAVVEETRTPIVNEISTEAIEFSDVENNENDSDQLNVTEDTMSTGLTWISTRRYNKTSPKSSKSEVKRTCRSLHFKSESSCDDHVSESEPESFTSSQPMVRLQNCLKLVDQTPFPDLTIHISKYPDTKPCTVRLKMLSKPRTKTKNEVLIEGYKILNESDINILENAKTEIRFRNYSVH
uniref:uncharacterized protein LOC120332166 isoform X1 n=1 Tax=Styela clava TaxID=7725 RepID=UPI00193AA46C|nr:uncharacterized protein LOC120332166 isoform X1 [Styela clava]